jgi:hypothetical protein
MSLVRALPVFAAMLWTEPGVAEGPAIAWTDEIASPRPASLANARDQALASACPEIDAGLTVVASQIAAHRVAANDVEAITFALRTAGEPHVWPRAFTLQGREIDRRDARARLEAWLADFRHPGRLRCGIASAHEGGREIIAAVAVDAQADLDRIPIRARTSSWIDVEARVLVPASGAKVVVMGPTGVPRTVPTSFIDGRARARANVDQPGQWLFQVLLDGRAGPRPVLEALVFAGVEPPVTQPSTPAPGEEAGTSGNGVAALTRMVDLARRSEGLPPLTRDADLERVAHAHAERMMRAAQLGHDVGDGDPNERVQAAAIPAHEVGENVAHAGDVVLAHRALWSSPSHRDNLLQRRFDRLGVGISNDADGTVWVTEIFANLR